MIQGSKRLAAVAQRSALLADTTPQHLTPRRNTEVVLYPHIPPPSPPPPPPLPPPVPPPGDGGVSLEHYTTVVVAIFALAIFGCVTQGRSNHRTGTRPPSASVQKRTLESECRHVPPPLPPLTASQILACCVWACKKTYGGAAKVKHQRLRNKKGTTELARVCIPASTSASSSTRAVGEVAPAEVAPELATGDDSSLAI